MEGQVLDVKMSAAAVGLLAVVAAAGYIQPPPLSSPPLPCSILRAGGGLYHGTCIYWLAPENTVARCSLCTRRRPP